MKKILMIAVVALASALTFSSCSSSNGGSSTPKYTIIGCWQLQWSDDNLDYADVYVEFNEDLTFELYQKLQAPTHTHYTGTYLFTDGVLTGKYSDGKAWGTTYNVEIEKDVITLISTTNPDDISVFNRCEKRFGDSDAVVASTRAAEENDVRFF